MRVHRFTVGCWAQVRSGAYAELPGVVTEVLEYPHHDCWDLITIQIPDDGTGKPVVYSALASEMVHCNSQNGRGAAPHICG